MSKQKGKMALIDLDLFNLLRLDHLSLEEKAKRIAEIQEIVLGDFLQEDLPELLSKEDEKEYRAIVADPKRIGELEGWLRVKVPDFDAVVRERMLTAKKEIVRQNMITRLDLARREQKEQKEAKAVQHQAGKVNLTKEKETLEKILTAIDIDDWSTASQLIRTL